MKLFTLNEVAKEIGTTKSLVKLHFDDLFPKRKDEKNPKITPQEKLKIFKMHDKFLESMHG